MSSTQGISWSRGTTRSTRWKKPKDMSSVATRMSQARASSMPPPITQPLSAAMIGFLVRCRPRVIPPAKYRVKELGRVLRGVAGRG
jgi:hypothetical protein